MKRIVLIVFLVCSSSLSIASPIDELMKYYNPGGELNFEAARGKALWFSQRTDEDGKVRDCTVCHGKDLTKKGEHAKTGKVIEPLATSVNDERFTKLKKVKKWFKRNCKWTFGRECTAQEKGDILQYLSQF